MEQRQSEFFAMPKDVATSPVTPETWRALLDAAADFATLAPWDFACDCDLVGLLDPVTGETRIGAVLGNAGEVFAAVFYRRVGLRWILSMVGAAPDPECQDLAEGMDCLKIEFVPKRELWKEDLAMLKAAGFKPAGKGPIWPQFRSSEPGLHPWHINQAEAAQLLSDLLRLHAFCKLFEQDLGLFEGRAATELPFLPTALPNRPLVPADLDWRPLVPPPPVDLPAFKPSAASSEELRALKTAPGLACEFDSTFMPGGSFNENGRPCFGRFSLLVDEFSGFILGSRVQSGALPPGEAAGRSLVADLLTAKTLPEKILIRDPRLEPVLRPLCSQLKIRLCLAPSLPMLEEAFEALRLELFASPSRRR